ncbi:MAG: 3-phosphoserine/phosphohydroxythreonine transaminase [Spirochaetaceae bacterium]|jgi:phosphoserine aminotransferase|nr:3-phosphoserine/phosphohydroxythreonine transaminase [Spirochaetaceae bacterium]
MQRVYNFSAGPSMLPLAVLEKAGAEIKSAGGTGQSVMEMSHRAEEFIQIIEKTERLFRSLLAIPDNYAVLFLQGGAMLQFSMLPINLAGSEPGQPLKSATYVDTGVWAKKAADEAAKYVKIRIRASSQDKNYTYIPNPPPAAADDAYYHICLNNTIVGTAWSTIPATGEIPLVADASSCLLSGPLDVRQFGVIYAGAQKNLGPAGCTVVIIRKDLIGRAPSWTPVMLRYDIHEREKSLFNTPPCWSIYVMSLVLEWIIAQGGLEAMARLNREKAAVLYQCLEQSRLFRSPVEKRDRSLMNVPFVVNDNFAEKRTEIERRFLSEAATAGLVNLAGHRLVGGLRASIYNAMPLEGVAALTTFINQFEGSY